MTKQKSPDHVLARDELRAAETAHDLAEHRHTNSSSAQIASFSRALAERRIAVLEARIRYDRAAAVFNASAADLETLRSFMLAELAVARASFANSDPPRAPAPLAATSSAALERFVAARLERARAVKAHHEGLEHAVARLAEAMTTVLEAWRLVRVARQKADEPAPVVVLPPPPLQARGAPFVVPANAADCDKLARYIEAQRVPAEPDTRSAQSEIAHLRAQIDEHTASERDGTPPAPFGSIRDRIAAGGIGAVR